PAEHPVQFADAGRPARLDLSFDLGHEPRRIAGPYGRARSGHFASLFQGVPASAVGTLADPLRARAAAFAADVRRPRPGHHDSPLNTEPRARYTGARSPRNRLPADSFTLVARSGLWRRGNRLFNCALGRRETGCG